MERNAVEMFKMIVKIVKEGNCKDKHRSCTCQGVLKKTDQGNTRPPQSEITRLRRGGGGERWGQGAPVFLYYEMRMKDCIIILT